MIRALIAVLILSGLYAHADIERFRFAQSGSFSLTVTVKGRPVSFKGEGLKEVGGEVTVTENGYTALIQSHNQNFVSVIISEDGNHETAELYLLERKNNTIEQMNENPIMGRPAVMREHFMFALDRFAKLKGLDPQDPSFAFRTMADYFDDSRGKTITSFKDDVELARDVVKVVPKPDTKVASTPGPAPQARQGGDDITPADPDSTPTERPRRPQRPRPDPRYAEPGYTVDPFGNPMPAPRPPRQRMPPGYQREYPAEFNDPRRPIAPPPPATARRRNPAPVPPQEIPAWAYEQEQANRRRAQQQQPRQPQRQVLPDPRVRPGAGDADTWPFGAQPYRGPMPQQGWHRRGGYDGG